MSIDQRRTEFRGARLMYGAVALMMAFHLLFGLNVIERMTGTRFGAPDAFFIYRVVALSVLAFVTARLALRSGLTAPFFSWFLALLVVYGLLTGAASGRHVGEMASHTIHAVTALMGFSVGYAFIRTRLDLWVILGATSYAALAFVALWLLMYFSAMADVNIHHYSLNFYVLVIPFAYFLARRELALALATFVLMILVGKRSIMLAGVVMIVWYAILGAGYGQSRHLRSVIVLAAALAGLLLSAMALASFFGASTLAPITGLGRTADITDLDALSSNRGDLIVSVVEMMNARPVQWWAGSGFGASFEHINREGLVYGVDIMPLHLIMLYGIPAALVMGLYFATVLLRGVISLPRFDDRKLASCVYMIVTGYLVCSMFTYVSTDPTFWFFLGVASFFAFRGVAYSPAAIPKPSI